LSIQAKQPKEKFNVWKPFIYQCFEYSYFSTLDINVTHSTCSVRSDTAGFAVLRPCGIAAADFGAKNIPPDCFLNTLYPIRV
jgi:hypothetical protein